MWQTDECLLWGSLFLMSGLQDTCTQFDPIRYGRGYCLDFVDGCMCSRGAVVQSETTTTGKWKMYLGRTGLLAHHREHKQDAHKQSLNDSREVNLGFEGGYLITGLVPHRWKQWLEG